MLKEKSKNLEERLHKIKEIGQNRKQKMDSEKKSLKEIFAKKPLFLMYEEKYQEEFVAKDLEEKKKMLQLKRSLQHDIPAGKFKQTFEEHNREYMIKKHENDSVTA